ncbi:hypothetical protein H845_1483 [Komagataeibacter xylinus E25]|nr:hypothetical protein H845_1483 [Komagataeibacter xylinus E25]
MAAWHNRPSRHPPAGWQAAQAGMPVILHLPCPAPARAVRGRGRAPGHERVITRTKAQQRQQRHAPHGWRPRSFAQAARHGVAVA